MPVPLWEDAKTWLTQQGVSLSGPDAHVILNDTMDKMAQGLVTRPSYGGNYGAPINGGSSIQETVLPSPIPSPAPVTKGSDEGYALPKSHAPGPVARNARARDAGQVRAEAGQVPVPTRKPAVPGNEPDVPGGAPPGPGQAVAGQSTTIPGSGSDDGMGLIGKLLSGLGLAAGVGGAAMAMRGGASAGMRPRSAPGIGIGAGITPPGGGPGSGFVGSMSGGPVVPGGPTITPSAMPPGIGANPMTGTLPLGAGPSATMPLPPPTVSLAAHGNVPMSGYGPTAQTSVSPSGPAMSVPPDVINQGGPDIAGILSAPQAQPANGGRIRSPRPRTPPTPKSKPTTKTGKKKSSQ